VDSGVSQWRSTEGGVGVSWSVEDGGLDEWSVVSDERSLPSGLWLFWGWSLSVGLVSLSISGFGFLDGFEMGSSGFNNLWSILDWTWSNQKWGSWDLWGNLRF
jgi:hypothetical protein